MRKRNADVDTGRLFAVGCSWTYKWPRHIRTVRDITWDDQGGGKGLGWMYRRLHAWNLRTYNSVVVQLPTPIRSTDRGYSFPTVQCFQWFLKTFEGIGETAARRVVLNDYKNTLLEINKLHPRVIFFVYNVGGYPFRCPFDFGEDAQDELCRWMDGVGLRYAVQDFEGQPGFAAREHAGERPEKTVEIKRGGKVFYPGCRWNIVDPPGYWIEDPHPNKPANKLAAARIEHAIAD